MRTLLHGRKRRGFTLIEMIGVLAVIAILAALLVPRIFAAINESRLSNTVTSVNAVKAATMQYFGKYGRFGGVGGITFTNLASQDVTNWDAAVLVPEGLLERTFAPRVSDLASVRVVRSATAAVAPTVNNAAYRMTATSTNNDASGGAAVVQVVLQNVAIEDALQLSKRIDGDPLSESAAISDDTRGRVKYAYSDNGVTDVYIYIASK